MDKPSLCTLCSGQGNVHKNENPHPNKPGQVCNECLTCPMCCGKGFLISQEANINKQMSKMKKPEILNDEQFQQQSHLQDQTNHYLEKLVEKVDNTNALSQQNSRDVTQMTMKLGELDNLNQKVDNISISINQMHQTLFSLQQMIASQKQNQNQQIQQMPNQMQVIPDNNILQNWEPYEYGTDGGPNTYKYTLGYKPHLCLKSDSNFNDRHTFNKVSNKHGFICNNPQKGTSVFQVAIKGHAAVLAALMVFQIQYDGMCTSIRISSHPGNDSAPPINSLQWKPITQGFVKMNTISGNNTTLTNPTIINITNLVQTKALLVEMKNDGSYGNPNYIEIGGLKGFAN